MEVPNCLRAHMLTMVAWSRVSATELLNWEWEEIKIKKHWWKEGKMDTGSLKKKKKKV